MESYTVLSRLGLFSKPRPLDRVELKHILWLVGIILAGAVLRFATLGSVGLHGDEETMGFAVRGLIENGVSAMPSGMEYRRAILQIYLQAASVLVFGESEFALRLPSAIVGTLLPLLLFSLGRRFVSTAFAIILALAAAFLPIFVTDSQTGRMYVFLVAVTGLALWTTFRWGETQRGAWLVATLIVLALAMQFQALAVLSLGMLLYPGLATANIRLLGLGIGAALLMALVFYLLDSWITAPYPSGLGTVLDVGAAEGWNPDAARNFIEQSASSVRWITVILCVGLAGLLTRSTPVDASRIATISLIALGFWLISIMHGYLGAIALMSGVVLAIRQYEGHRPAMLLVLTLGIALLLAQSIHAGVLLEEALRRAIGTQMGVSPWPLMQLGSLVPAFALVTALGAIGAVSAWSRREAISSVWLIFVLLVLIPMTFMGLIAWYVPTRYTEGSLIPLLLAGAWSAEQLVCKVDQKLRCCLGGFSTKALVVSAVLVLVNPNNFLRAFKDKTPEYPDHKGAAEFILKNDLHVNSILIAEDVLQQTYYLGHVDYWLIGPHVAGQFAIRTAGGHIVDIYTATQLLTDSEKLDVIMKKADLHGMRVILIGSGEEQQDGRAFARGGDLSGALKTINRKVLYVGKDRLTKVWTIKKPGADTNL